SGGSRRLRRARCPRRTARTAAVAKNLPASLSCTPRKNDSGQGYATALSGSRSGMPTPILVVEQLTVSFDGFTVLDDLDFSMQPGELRFLIGPNGAGKTTLLDIVTGKTRPHHERVTFDGRVDLLHKPEHELVRLGIARKFQAPSVFAGMTVYQNLELALG